MVVEVLDSHAAPLLPSQILITEANSGTQRQGDRHEHELLQQLGLMIDTHTFNWASVTAVTQPPCQLLYGLFEPLELLQGCGSPH